MNVEYLPGIILSVWQPCVIWSLPGFPASCPVLSDLSFHSSNMLELRSGLKLNTLPPAFIFLHMSKTVFDHMSKTGMLPPLNKIPLSIIYWVDVISPRNPLATRISPIVAFMHLNSFPPLSYVNKRTVSLFVCLVGCFCF